MTEAVVLQAAVIALALYYGIRALREITHILDPRFVFVICLIFLFIMPYYQVEQHVRERFLQNGDYALLMTVAILSFTSFAFGVARARSGNEGMDQERPHPALVMAGVSLGLAGQAILIMAAGGVKAYFGTPHRGAVPYGELSAYVYSLPALAFTFLVIGLALSEAAPQKNLTALWAYRIIGSFLLVDALLQGDRSDTILVLTGAAIVYLPRVKAKMARTLMIAIGGVGVVTIAILPYVRTNLTFDIAEALSEVEAQWRVLNRAGVSLDPLDSIGVELFTGAAAVGAGVSDGDPSLGRGWVYPWINIVPRFLWAEKPYAAEWFINDAYGRLAAHAGWEPAYGSSWTGIGDVVLEFGWLGIAIWFPLGLWVGRWWKRFCKNADPISMGRYWALLNLFIVFQTQIFNTAWSVWLFSYVPIGLVAWGGPKARLPQRATRCTGDSRRSGDAEGEGFWSRDSGHDGRSTTRRRLWPGATSHMANLKQ